VVLDAATANSVKTIVSTRKNKLKVEVEDINIKQKNQVTPGMVTIVLREKLNDGKNIRIAT
jgi:hypothetical protein